MQENSPISLSPAELFRFVLRGLPLALIVALSAAAVAFQLSQNQAPRFETRATVFASQSRQSQDPLGRNLYTPPPVDVSVYQIAAKSEPVLKEALTLLGTLPADQNASAVLRLREEISVYPVETELSSLVHIDALGETPEQATEMANAVARALVSWDNRRASENFARTVESLEEQVSALDNQIRSLQVNDAATPEQVEGFSRLRAERQEDLAYARALGASALGRLETLEFATPPLLPISPRPRFNATVAFVLGVLLAYGALLLRQALDTRLRGAEDLARVSDLPVLAEFPKLRRGVRRLPVEAVSYLRTNVLLETANAHPNIILVTSSKSGEGKSSVALSLAESFARSEHRTLLVDADMRRPVIDREYDLDPSQDVSLAFLLDHPEDAHRPVSVQVSKTQVLHIVPSFEAPAAPTDLLSNGLRERLEGWRSQYDAIVIDSPPVLSVADPLIIAPLCTGTVLVTDMRTTNRRQLRSSVELLQRVGIKLLGVVATQVTNPSQSGTRPYTGRAAESDYATPKRVREGEFAASKSVSWD